MLMHKRTISTCVILALAVSASCAEESTKVTFKNVHNVEIYVVTDYGPKKARGNFTLHPKKSESVSVGDGALTWCSYSDKNRPCTPDKEAKGGDEIDLKP